MKKTFLSAALLINMAAFAQVQQGTIIYECKVDVHRRMQDEQMKALVPQYQTTKKQLIFNNTESVYKNLQEDNAPDPFENTGGGNIRIRIGGPGENTVLYKNFSNQQFLEQTQVSDKDYVIDDTIHTTSWKLSDETKNILDHTCKKATMKTKRGSDVTAWYAADIASPAGPDVFDGLPGIILQADINNGEIQYTATAINPQADTKELQAPSEGKHITRAEFDKKMEEIFGAPTPDGRRIIRRNN